MSKFTQEQLRQRAFERAAWVLKHFWEEQQDNLPRLASVHSRVFDTLVYPEYITLGKSKNGSGHKEHLVPCALLRDRAFAMYWDGKTEKDVAQMLERLLRIAHITPEEAHHLDHNLGYKLTMPDDWNWETGSVMTRLEVAGIELKTE